MLIEEEKCKKKIFFHELNTHFNMELKFEFKINYGSMTKLITKLLIEKKLFYQSIHGNYINLTMSVTENT